MNPAANSDQRSSGAASVNSLADFGPGKEGQAKRWKAELASAKRSETDFVKRAEKTVRRYRDERDAVDAQDRKFNILWSNVQTLKPAIYAKPPVPEVSRRFDTSSDVNRVAAMILERNLEFTVCEHSQFDATMNQCVEDRLLPGRGTAWVRYVADLKPMYADRPAPATTQGTPAPAGAVAPATPAAVPGAPPAPPNASVSPGMQSLPPGPLPMNGAPTPTPMPAPTPPQPEAAQNKALTDDAYESKVVTGEMICFDYVHWKDFRMSPCRTWDECCWVARRVFMSRDNGVQRFGDEFKEVPLNYAEKDIENQRTGGNKEFGPGPGVLKKAAVWEIWSKDDLKVYWVCEDYDKVLDERDDLFQLDDFFPCPKPLLATTTNDSTIPIPDYCMYQDQAQELDQITNRISLLTQALKVIGVYDKAQDAVQRLLTEGVDNVMIPVDNWGMFAERGGLKGTVDFFPVEMVMNVLERLINARGVVKQDVYEITGIADIVRGATVASETATAQTIKERFANIRINNDQKDIARFASDLVNSAAQLMVNFFQPETLLVNADLGDPAGPDFQFVPAALQLVKNGKLIQHKISVTVDSITEKDEKEEKEARAEFMQQFGYLMQQAVPAVEKIPSVAPMIGHVILWAVRGYKVGRDIEGAIEQGLAAMTAQPAQPAPNAAQQKLLAEQQAHQQELQHEQEAHQADMKKEQDVLALKQAQNKEDLDFTRAKHNDELAFIRAKNALALEGVALQTTAKVEAAAQATNAELDASAATHVQGLVQGAEKHAQGLAQASDTHAQGLAQGADEHAQGLVQGQQEHELGQEQAAEAGNLKLEQAEAAAKAKKEGGNA
jgi:hypothetical protein